MQETARKDARMPQGREPRLHPAEEMRDNRPPLRARTLSWLRRWFGMAAIGLGWAAAFAMVLMPQNLSWVVWRFEVGVVAAMLLGVGLGWQLRDEGGKRGRR